MAAMARRRHFLLGSVVALFAAMLAAGCGGGGGDDNAMDVERSNDTITFWSLENQPDRVRATRANLAIFTRKTGVRVNLVVVGDDKLVEDMERAKASRRIPDVVQMPLESAHTYARERILDMQAAEDVLRRLGENTFSQTALSLVGREGSVAAVPSDGWGQLLIYRKDLFRAAGLRAPATLADVQRAARRLHRDGMAGITLATSPEEGFMSESFEQIALAAGCQLVDDLGNITLTSRRCRRAFRFYTDLARNYSVGGVQTVDSTRDAYFAGRAAMIFWSPFLLDAMAGLRDDALPTCPQCRRDRAYLARNSGLVGALSDADLPPAQYASITTWGIGSGAHVDSAKRLVEYLLSEGYPRWLALSPQGKYPVRSGDSFDPERYEKAWARLQSGVERKAPLRRFYSAESIESLADGVLSFRRWAFEQGQAALLGALRGPQPVARALAAAIRGDIDPDTAAGQAQAAVEKLAASTR
jgi:multiple sugar transport system substrate-binding protein